MKSINQKEQQQAKVLYESIKTKPLTAHEGTVRYYLKSAQQTIELPRTAVSLLKKAMQLMSMGQPLSIIPIQEEISTQKAAELLGISRPHLVKLLEEGKIPFRKVGSHRRLFLADVKNYGATVTKTRRSKLNVLSKQAQKLKMGYN